jgi:hypothetical protein
VIAASSSQQLQTNGILVLDKARPRATLPAITTQTRRALRYRRSLTSIVHKRRRRSVATPFLCCASPFYRDNDHPVLGTQTDPTRVIPTFHLRKPTSPYNLTRYLRYHTVNTMARTSGRTLSGLVAILFLFLLVTPARAAWNEAYCSKQNTGTTDVCK